MAKMQNMFKPSRSSKATPRGNSGYDNARENIDPQVIQRHEPLSINFFIDGGGAVIDTGVRGCVRIPFLALSGVLRSWQTKQAA